MACQTDWWQLNYRNLTLIVLNWKKYQGILFTHEVLWASNSIEAGLSKLRKGKPVIPYATMGIRQAVKAQDFDSCIRWFESNMPNLERPRWCGTLHLAYIQWFGVRLLVGVFQAINTLPSKNKNIIPKLVNLITWRCRLWKFFLLQDIIT